MTQVNFESHFHNLRNKWGVVNRAASLLKVIFIFK